MNIDESLKGIIREAIKEALAEYFGTSSKRLDLSQFEEVKWGNKNTADLDLMTAKEVAGTLRCSLRSAYDVMDEKGFPLIQIGSKKRVNRDDFVKWLNNNKQR